VKNDDEQNRHSQASGQLSFDLIDLGVAYGRLASVSRRLARCLPVLDANGAAEFGWLRAEARALDERIRRLWDEKIDPGIDAEIARFLNPGRPPWPE
jgi:hypothetical protein